MKNTLWGISMTVRLEQVSLVLRRAWLDAAFPGGSTAFLKAPPVEAGTPVHMDCDGDLVALSAPERASLAASAASLLELGATMASPDALRKGEMVIVDQADAVTATCSWLRCVLDPDGAAYADYRSASAPSDPEKSRILLGTADGQYTWLDMETGRFVCEPVPSALELVQHEIVRREWAEFDRDEAAGKISLFVNAGILLNVYLQFIARDTPDTLVLNVRLPGRVDEDDRSEIGEFLLMANWGLKVGSFDLDHSDGEVIYRIGIPTKDQVLSQSVVGEMIDCALTTVQHYADGLLRVVRGCSPREIIDELDRKPSAE
jgi:hypothetical protein